MIGRFLELSVYSDDVLASLRFYERLGFRELDTGDTWSHPYAVVSDGRIHIGLHGYRFESPALTFVLADIKTKVPHLERSGIRFEFCKLDPDEFNEAGFRAPDGTFITLLEARTYSPPPFDEQDISWLGRLSGIGLRSPNVEEDLEFWTGIGLREAARHDDPYPRATVSGEGIVVALHQKSLDLKLPALCFDSPDLNRTAAQLQDADIDAMLIDAPPDTGRAVRVTSPEGLSLVICDPASAR